MILNEKININDIVKDQPTWKMTVEQNVGQAEVERLREVIIRMIGACGIPDKGDALREVIKRGTEGLCNEDTETEESQAVQT